MTAVSSDAVLVERGRFSARVHPLHLDRCTISEIMSASLLSARIYLPIRFLKGNTSSLRRDWLQMSKARLCVTEWRLRPKHEAKKGAEKVCEFEAITVVRPHVA